MSIDELVGKIKALPQDSEASEALAAATGILIDILHIDKPSAVAIVSSILGAALILHEELNKDKPK